MIIEKRRNQEGNINFQEVNEKYNKIYSIIWDKLQRLLRGKCMELRTKIKIQKKLEHGEMVQQL